MEGVRAQFPILNTRVKGHPLVYLDNAATTQKPQSVINAITDYYTHYNSNVHRGVHHLSNLATNAMEESRVLLKDFINASSIEEVIFTTGTTGSINLVAQSFGQTFLKSGDEVLLTELEHHSNIVPWQLACEITGAKVKVVAITDDGALDMDDFEQKLSEKTKLVAVSHISNSLGTINPIKQIIDRAHEMGAAVLVDGAQALAHRPIDVQALDCDFYCMSAHKAYGPTGIGALFGKKKWLEKMNPYQGGGEMISSVSFEKTTYNNLPFKFEAGTPNIAGIIGFGAAIKFLQSQNWDEVITHEKALLHSLQTQISNTEGVTIYGTSENKSSVVSFGVEGVLPYDVGVLLDNLGIAVRTGQHCTEPLMCRLGITGTVRASLAIYNNEEDVTRLIAGLERVIPMLV